MVISPETPREPCQKRHGLQLFIVTFIQIMLPREQRIPTAIPRELDHRDLVVQGGNHVRGQLLLVRNEKTHLHEKSLPG